ncbi:MAG: ABC transporter permease subunit, partial [Rhodospirillales bacterium]|nr:ABC transporter permease subunit [Rhodospirillales bacterium]
SVLFGGDLKGWLAYNQLSRSIPQLPNDSAFGRWMLTSGVGGWIVMMLPLSAVFVAWFVARMINPMIRELSSDWSSAGLALIDLVKFIAAGATAVTIACAVGLMLHWLGFDPRGPMHLGNVGVAPMGNYVVRNSLIVGFVMGFAVIPIIYTIAEDALSAVPEHLRSASLGCGATPWQTATRVILPVAMSGMFSACMIGLGRAVGETMIVLMAAGNTPLMELNVFNAFHTLSAAIATEMPEAAKDSSHARVLYLAGLVLFVMTFVVNTVAEVVRLRFRKRNRSL